MSVEGETTVDDLSERLREMADDYKVAPSDRTKLYQAASERDELVARLDRAIGTLELTDGPPMVVTTKFLRELRAALLSSQSHLATMRKEIARLKSAIVKAREDAIAAESQAAALAVALKGVEFDVHGKCSACVGWMVSPAGETPSVHTKDCPVARALSAAGD